MAIKSQSEFVTESFETTVTEEDVRELTEVIQNCVRELRGRIRSDETLENLLDPEKSPYVLRSEMSTVNQDPEPLTQEAIIEPLLRTLGYEELITEVGSAAPERDRIADYAIQLDDPLIESNQLLIEAEPMNKPLERRGHGTDQVQEWLRRRDFNSDFGIATDGLRWIFIRHDPETHAHNRLADVGLGNVFLSLFYNLTGPQVDAVAALSEDDIQSISDFIRAFDRANLTSIAVEAHEIIRETQEEISEEFYDEYIRIVFGVRESGDNRSPRSLVGDGVIPPEEASGEDTRLFAVKLMNRLIFVKFLEDKRLVNHDLLNELNDLYGDGAGHTVSMYKAFIEPLFFEVMNHKPNDRAKHVKNIEQFEGVPFLNGGLFRPVLGDEGLDEREFDVENSVLKDAISLLERYEFSADAGPTDLDPSVLGNVFEKTINYLTTDPGDRNKELGAYFTPKEITRFCAVRTVRPALLERFENHLIHERNWQEAEVNYESVYSLIDDLPAKTSLITELLSEVVDEFRALDPAMGSGHFLTSVMEEIVSIRVALYRKIGWEVDEHQIKKTTVQNNIYGVDIVGPAVEIGKLRLWLAVIGAVNREDIPDLNQDELALPNIAFNLRVGNSLIGFTGFTEKTEDGDGYNLEAFSEDSVRQRYSNIINEINLYEEKGWEGNPDEAEEHRRTALNLIEEAREELVDDLHGDFKEAGIDNITVQEVGELEPFHWVLEFAEAYAEGGFDVIVGNPPWDVLTPNREEFFSRYEPEFRGLLPQEKDEKEEELLENEWLSKEYDQYKRTIELQAQYFNQSSAYELQSPKVGGRTIANENDLSALFLERIFELGRDDSHISQVLPGFVWNGAACKNLRDRLLDGSELNILTIFENQGIFENIHHQYMFGVVVFRNSGETDQILGRYSEGNVGILKNIEETAVKISRNTLESYSPKSRIFPYISSQTEADLLDKILQYPSLGEYIDGAWNVDIKTKELHEPTDKGRFISNQNKGDYPVYDGANIYQFQYDTSLNIEIREPRFWSKNEYDPENSAKYRVREKAFRKGYLKKSLYKQFGGDSTNQSQKAFVNNLLEKHRGHGLSMDDILPDFTEYRIGYRNVTNATNERTMISSVLPKGIPCIETLQTFRPYYTDPKEEDLSKEVLHDAYKRLFTDKELFLATGLMNSIPFDFLMRTKIDTHIVKYKLEESQVPRLTEGDDWFEYIWTRAARLNCYGEEFAEMRERLGDIEPATEEPTRRDIQAEIDAAAFHAYGLDRKETKFILDDFHRVQNPRIMDEEYFDMVLGKFDNLSNN